MKDNMAIIALVGLATLALGWVISPFLGAVLWAVVIAIVLYPLYNMLLERLNGRSNLASLATVTIVLLIVIIPLLMIAVVIIREAVADRTPKQPVVIRLGPSMSTWDTASLD